MALELDLSDQGTGLGLVVASAIALVLVAIVIRKAYPAGSHGTMPGAAWLVLYVAVGAPIYFLVLTMAALDPLSWKLSLGSMLAPLIAEEAACLALLPLIDYEYAGWPLHSLAVGLGVTVMGGVVAAIAGWLSILVAAGLFAAGLGIAYLARAVVGPPVAIPLDPFKAIGPRVIVWGARYGVVATGGALFTIGVWLLER